VGTLSFLDLRGGGVAVGVHKKKENTERKRGGRYGTGRPKPTPVGELTGSSDQTPENPKTKTRIIKVTTSEERQIRKKGELSFSGRHFKLATKEKETKKGSSKRKKENLVVF